MARVAKKKVSRRQTGAFDPRTIIELRQAVGRLMGKDQASRETIARLLEVSPGSVFNWEHGTIPTRHVRHRIAELKQRAEAGELSLGSNGKVAPASDLGTTTVAPSSNGGGLKPVYANAVAVRKGKGEVWLDFYLRTPEGATKELVGRFVMPRDAADALSRV